MASDLNDPRITIPTLHKGDPIRESFLRDITGGINGRRGVSNPPQQVFRRPPFLGSGVIYAQSWVTADKQHASTVTNLNGTLLSIASDNNGSYTGTTVGKKAVINFEQNIAIKGSTPNRSPVIVLGQMKSTSLATSAFSGTAGSSGGCFTQVFLQATCITASFTTSTLTWNTLGSLTLGTVLIADEYARATSNLANGVASPSAVAVSFAAGSNNLNCLAFVPTFANIDSNCYGLLIEMKPVGSSTSSGVTCSSSSVVAETFLQAGALRSPCIIIPVS